MNDARGFAVEVDEDLAAEVAEVQHANLIVERLGDDNVVGFGGLLVEDVAGHGAVGFLIFAVVGSNNEIAGL